MRISIAEDYVTSTPCRASLKMALFHGAYGECVVLGAIGGDSYLRLLRTKAETAASVWAGKIQAQGLSWAVAKRRESLALP